MGRFVMECPNCHKSIEASSGLFGTGLFAKKDIKCSCGITFNVQANRLSSRQCSHCGNTVVYDQAKSDKAMCPVCHKPVNELSDRSKMAAFTCEQCGVSLLANKSASEPFICPICDFPNDVQKRVSQENIKNSGKASTIKYEGDNDTFVFKHPVEDFNLGSQLIVHESQQAVFFRDGQALDLFKAGRYTLETQKLPILDKLYKLPMEPEGTFHSEVYFINMAVQTGLKWGTANPISILDPGSGLNVEISAYGDFNIRVTDSRKLLIKLVGTTGSMRHENIIGESGKKGFFRGITSKIIPAVLHKTIKGKGYKLVDISLYLEEMSDALRDRINTELDNYGLEITEFNVINVNLPEPGKNKAFDEYRSQFGKIDLLKTRSAINRAEAEAEAQKELVHAETKAQTTIIGARAEAEAHVARAAAKAQEMQMQGYTYEDETRRQVASEAVKNGIGGGAAGGIGEIAGMGIALGTMGSVIGMTRDAMATAVPASQDIGKNMVPPSSRFWACSCGAVGNTGNFCRGCGNPKPSGNTWDCSCGNKNNTGKFCDNCGKPKPSDDSWTCSCGQTGNKTKFCGNCGKPKPSDDSWTCSCGQTGNKTKFCGNCGKPKPSDDSWTCSCGQTGNKTKFCGNCGKPKPSDDSWTCSCGQAGNKTKFCGNCGKPKPSDT